jgi:hypothetical protein
MFFSASIGPGHILAPKEKDALRFHPPETPIFPPFIPEHPLPNEIRVINKF